MNVDRTDSSQYRINARVYQHGGIEQSYQNWTLMRAEGIALLKYQPAFTDKDVLDVGVGTGRTSLYLAPLARHYQATDYSPVMVRYMQATMPETPILLADMRHMPELANASFDFVLASNCVFDAVGHEGRLHTLKEIHRLLRPGGVLMFSTHNRDCADAVHKLRLELSRNPFHQLVLTGLWFRGLINRTRLKRLQTFTDDYAIINDAGHEYALLHYYIGPDAQKRQLVEEGFEVVDVFDNLGNPVLGGNRAPASKWLLYVARRVPMH